MDADDLILDGPPADVSEGVHFIRVSKAMCNKCPTEFEGPDCMTRLGEHARQMHPDPTPAVPMDPEFVALADALWLAGFEEYDATSTRAALWAAVVAYGDRRAEEARGALVELVREAWSEGRNTGIGMGHALHTRSKYDEWDESEAAERLAALSSPAPEGVDDA